MVEAREDIKYYPYPIVDEISHKKLLIHITMQLQMPILTHKQVLEICLGNSK